MSTSYHSQDGTVYTYVPYQHPPIQGAAGYADATYQGYKFRREPEYFLWEIYAREDGGIVPAKLRCKFTSLAMAKTFLIGYLAEEEAKKEKRDAREF
jgi:hypothetical protein